MNLRSWNLIKTQIPWNYALKFWFRRFWGCDLGICISYKLPGDAGAVGPQTTLSPRKPGEGRVNKYRVPQQVLCIGCMACPVESWWPIWLTSPFILKHLPEWILNNKVTLLIFIISSNPYKESQGRYYYSILQIHKWSLDRLSTFAKSHIVSKWYSLELEPSVFCSKPTLFPSVNSMNLLLPILLLFGVGWTAGAQYLASLAIPAIPQGTPTLQ